MGSGSFTAVSTARADGTTDFFALNTVGNDAVAANEATANAQAAGLVGAFTAAELLPTPTDKSSTAAFGAPQDVTQVSAIASQFVDFGQVNLVQGTIDLPYYMGVPTGASDAEGSAINWVFSWAGLTQPSAMWSTTGSRSRLKPTT